MRGTEVYSLKLEKKGREVRTSRYLYTNARRLPADSTLVGTPRNPETVTLPPL
jgi:hypothetical protein